MAKIIIMIIIIIINFRVTYLPYSNLPFSPQNIPVIDNIKKD